MRRTAACGGTAFICVRGCVNAEEVAEIAAARAGGSYWRGDALKSFYRGGERGLCENRGGRGDGGNVVASAV